MKTLRKAAGDMVPRHTKPDRRTPAMRARDQALGRLESRDPRVCRMCGKKVLDMKYHLEKDHPRRATEDKDRERVPRLDPQAEAALRELSSLLTDAREVVFKEPLRAIALLDRANEWATWLQDRSKVRPMTRLPSSKDNRPVASTPQGGQRRDMRIQHNPSRSKKSSI